MSPIRFRPLTGRVAIVADIEGRWVQHEFPFTEAAELAGEFARAIVEAERMTATADATWDLKRAK